MRAYQDLAVGSHGWRDLLLYEIGISGGSLIPGAAGVLFRRYMWKKALGKCGRGVIWGRNVTIRHPGKMVIGEGVVTDDDCFFDAKGCAIGEFMIGDGAMVSRGSILSGKDGFVRVGARVNVGPGCYCYSSGGIEIGADTLLAGRCYIGGGQYDLAGPLDEPMWKRPQRGKGVRIGANCWLGAGVVVIDGVEIGSGSVVGAGAVVTRDLPANSVAVGIPARRIAERPLHGASTEPVAPGDAGRGAGSW